MTKKISTLFILALTAGCTGTGSQPSATSNSAEPGRLETVETTRDGTSKETTLDGYKRDVAQRISQVNAEKVFIGRPQALLRSVVVVKYVIDSHGALVRSEIIRSNHDKVTESTALTSIRSAAPFPKPTAALLRYGKLEVSETWLFNNDGRFQLRSIASAQMDE